MDMEDIDRGVVDQPNADDPWLNKLAVPSFYPIYRRRRAIGLSEAWPMVESSFKEIGIACTLDQRERKIRVSTPTRTMDPDIFHKAGYLFQLLSRTRVRPTLAIEIALNGRDHDLIEFGTQEGGLGSKYRMKREECDILRRFLSHSLKDLASLTRCKLFLTKKEYSLTAVGPSRRLGLVRRVIEGCITENKTPEFVINAFKMKFEQPELLDDLDLLCKIEKTGSLLNKDGAGKVAMSFQEGRATKLEEAWSMVVTSLNKYDISCTLNQVKRTITISTTGVTKEDPDAFDKAGYLLELLTTSNVPPSLAIELALNGRQHEFIRMGTQEGGLCSKHRIKKEQFRKRRARLIRSVKGIHKVTNCDIYCAGRTITAVSSSLDGLRNFRTLVLYCMVKDVYPEHCIKNDSDQFKLKLVKDLTLTRAWRDKPPQSTSVRGGLRQLIFNSLMQLSAAKLVNNFSRISSLTGLIPI